VALSGTGVAPTTLSPTSANFGNVVINQTSAIKTITLKNNQAISLGITSLTLPAGGYAFDPSTTCPNPGSLLAGASCTIALTLTPTALGAVPAGSLTINTDATTPQTVTLSGTGIVPVTLSPASIAFGAVATGTTSATKTVALKNNQTSALTITNTLFGGPFALDTSSITTCPQSSGVVSGTLAAGASCIIGITYKPTAAAPPADTGQITVLDTAGNSPQFTTLSGSGVSPVTISPPSIYYGNVVVNTGSSKNITLANNQAVALNLTSITPPALFAVAPATTTCVVGTPVPPVRKCTITLTYTPTALGALSSGTTLSIVDDAGTQTINLTGTGVAPVILSPTILSFGTAVVGQATIKKETLTNNQTVALTINSITGFTGGYTPDLPDTTCPMTPLTLGPGQNCVIAVSLTATATGSQTGQVTVNHSAGTQTFNLSGSAIQPVTFSPTSLSFPAQPEGITSTAKTVTLTNTQNVPLNIYSVAVTGANASDFGVTSTCPISTLATPVPIPANSNCMLSVTFTPTGSGTRKATLSITDGATGSPQTLALSGAGNAPVTISPVSITSFSAKVGTTSPYQKITITNSSTTLPLSFTSFQLSGDFTQTSTTCLIGPASPLAPGASCALTVSFAPTIGGVRTGQLQVYDTAVTSPQVVNLSGTGTNPLTLSTGSLIFSMQKIGSTSPPQHVTLTNNETQSETFTLTPTGDFIAGSNCAGGVIAAKSSCIISINFVPSGTGTRTGSVSVAHSAAIGSPLTVSLSGSGSNTNPPAAVAVVSPGAGSACTTPSVTITGNGWTHFSSSSAISFVDTQSSAIASDITVQSFTAVSPNQINAQLSIACTGVIYGARNIKVVTPLTGGGTETAQLYQAFTIADPTLAHTITSVTPAFGAQGATLNVNLTAVGTHFVQGTTFANFGDGITVNYLTVTDATDAQANITISNTTPVGYRTITLVTGGEYAVSSNGIFQIGPNNATLNSVTCSTDPTILNNACSSSPTSAAQGSSAALVLTASGTHFQQDATQVSISGGVLVGNVAVSSPTTATAQIAVTAGAALGVQNVTVSTGGEIATLPNSFTITGATPTLVSVVPATGLQGQTLNVVVTGNAYTAFVAGQVSGAFPGNITVNSTTVNSLNQVTFNITISPTANIGSFTANLVSGPSGSQSEFPFTFSVTGPVASIVSVTPNSVPQGGQVTLTVTGLNTLWVQGTTLASFYPSTVPVPQVDLITINSATSALLNIAVPTNTPPGSYSFYMATGGQVVSASISVYANTPSLTMNPANGQPGATMSVTFTGEFTHFSSGVPNTFAVMGGQGVSLQNFTVTSPVSATATLVVSPAAGPSGDPICLQLGIPANLCGLHKVTLTTGGEIVSTYFSVGLATLTQLWPYHAPQSTTLDVEITGANTHFAAGTTQVLFGPQITVNSVTVNSATDLTVNITTSYVYNSVTTPTPPGWQAVYVNTSAEQLVAGFHVDAPAQPTLVSIVPSSAAQGSTAYVTITGSLTNWSSQTEAIVGAGVTVSSLTILDPTTATATISVSPTAPVGPNSVIMITGSEVVSGAGFSVTPSAAEIISVAPAVQNCGTSNVADFCGVSPTSTTPYVVSQLQTATLNIGGVGTHWLQGETSVSFGPGVVIDSLNVTSPTAATVKITVLSTAPVGFAALTTYTDGEVVTLQQAIDIEQGFPTFLAMTPNAGEQGNTFNLQVLGRFTNWQQGVTSAAFNHDITVNSITVIDSDNLIANITVTPWAYVDYSIPCGHIITITTGTEQVTSPIGSFCVTQGPASISNVSPAIGVQGSTETVYITGSFTNFIKGVTTVSFNDGGINVGQVTVTDSTHLSVPIAVTTSSSTGYKTVTAITYGEVASQQYAFTVSPGVATLNEAIPNQGEQGAPLGSKPLVVQLIGQYSHFNGQTTATFGPGITVNSVTYVSNTEVDANITIDPLSYVGGRTVTVTTPNVLCSLMVADTRNACPTGATYGSEIVSNDVFNIIPGPAIITQVAPGTGNEGQEVVFTITGANTHWAQNFTQFYIPGAGSDLTINSVIINSPTSATVDMSIGLAANPGPRSIFMVTAGESLVDSGAFVITGGVPVITYISPNAATPGTTQLEVTIHGLFTQWTQGTPTLNFGTGVTVTSFQVDDDTHIEAVLNVDPAASIGWRTVIVKNGAQLLTGNFLVQATPPPPVPGIWYYWPSSGLPGQTFTISFAGTNTHWDPNPDPTIGTSGTFGDGITVNTFQVTSPTSVRANITIDPATYAGQRMIVFTTPSASENESVGFNVVIAQPVLSVVDPGSGMQGAQNLTVNIMGQYTTFDATTTFSFGPGITVTGPPTILGPTIATQSISIDQLAALGGRGVTATTPDAAAIAQVISGAGFTVTPSLALISAITPNTAKQGDTIQVEVTGQNTHWSPATKFQFGAGIVVTSTTVNSNTDATLVLAIPALASLGATGANAQTAGEVANISNGFVVQAGTPLLLSSGPGSVPQQSTVVFTILSQATQWLTSNPTVDFGVGSGITLTNISITSNTSLTVNGYVQPTTYVGCRNLTVSTGTQALSLPCAVYVVPGPAVINSVSPSSGGQGATLSVNITGTNTHWQQGVTQLSFPGVLFNSVTVNSATSITANITVSDYAQAGQVSVTATTLGEVATGINVFTVIQTQPELLAVVLGSGTQGQTETVTLTGQFTHFSNSSTVNFGPGITVNSVTASSFFSLQANITVQPTTTLGYRNVSVTTGTEVVSMNNAFQVTQGPAAILALNPASGGEGNPVFVMVIGSQTNFKQGVTTAAFGGGISVTGITVTDALHASVNISIPSSTPLGAYNVTLTTAGEVATILGGFTVTTGTPVLFAVSPPTGNQGSTFDVALTGLFTHFVSGTSAADFGAGITVNSTTVTSSTTATANITISQTATLGSRTVKVTTNTETATIVGGFTVLAGIPQLLSAAPGSAQAGATGVNVVIDGEFTTFQQGFSSVDFGSGVTTNFVTVNSVTQLTANISVSANAVVGSRNITVTTTGTPLTLSNGFAITPGTPIIIQINPNIGNPGGTATVTITGQYTNWINGTTTASFGPQISVGGAAEGASGPVTVNSPTSLTANLSIDAAASLGPVTVIVTTGSEVETVPGGFTVQALSVTPPYLLSLSPGANVGGMPINSSIIAVFSQPMNRATITTGSVLLYLVSNPSQGWIQVPGSVTVDATGRKMTFTPNSLLAVNSTYYFQLTNAIQDATGNAINNYGWVAFSTAFSANSTPPTVVAVNPPALSTVGTNVPIQLEFSTDMDQTTQSGLIVSTGGNPVAGTYSWNSNPYGSGGWGPGTILTFTPTAPLQANTSYLVSWGAPLADTAGIALTPGSFTFNTGSGPDTAQNYAGVDFANWTNVGTNFVPKVAFSKPINPIDVNTGTLLLYNYDSGKYVLGAVNVAADGLSATIAPAYPLLPNTYYHVQMSWGYYDADGNYLQGVNGYFTTGDGFDLTPPQVASVSPVDQSTQVPLNANIVVHFSEAIDPSNYNVVTVTPAGGSSIAGAASLAGDLVTLTFTPAANLQGNTQYTVQVSGYRDMSGNLGTTFTSTFTTMTSVAPLVLSTGLDASGNLITTGDAPDAHWLVVPNGSSTPQPVLIVAPANADWYSGQVANGPGSSWIALNPDSVGLNTYGTYYTNFDLTGYNLNNVCLTGTWWSTEWGSVVLNGNVIASNTYNYNSGLPLSATAAYLNQGANTLSIQWTYPNTWRNYAAFRLQASIQTCGATYTGGLSLVSATPSWATQNVPTNTSITLNFNKALDPATVNANTLAIMVGWNSNQQVAGNYQVTGSQVIFTPSGPFPANSSIYVGACNGPYDLIGESAGGCYTQLDYFVTGSTTTPGTPALAPFQVLAFTPAANATNVGLRAPVVATFNRSFNPGTINQNGATDFALFAGDSQSPWCGSYSKSQDNSTLQFSCSPLPSSTIMTAMLNGGLQDWSGNALANFTSQFTTSQYDSNTNGTVISARPGTGSGGIDPNSPLVLYTNLPINPAGANSGIQVAQNNVAIPGSVQVLDNGYTLQFTPSIPFTPGALIQWWTTGNLTNTTYGTNINGTSGYFWIAGDTSTAAPSVQVISPPNWTSVALNSFFDLQFNTPLDPTTVNSASIYLYDTSTGLNIPVTYSMPQPNVVRMVPQANLSPDGWNYIYVNGGLHSSTSVPAFSGSGYTYFGFYTAGSSVDSTLPLVVSAVPYNGSKNVGVNVAPGVVFSKAIDPVSVNSSTFQVLNGSTPLVGSY
jgi:hypothetical protein